MRLPELDDGFSSFIDGVKIMDLRIFFLIFLSLFQIDFTFEAFPNVEISQRYFGFQDEAINITCPIHCKNCTSKAEVLWLKDGEVLANNGLVTHYGETLCIKHYLSGEHNGSYSCIWKFKELTLRSTPIHLMSFYLPKYTVHNASLQINNTAVFHCYKPSSATVNTKDSLVVQWFQGDSVVPLSPTPAVIIRDELLFMKNVQQKDVGSYHCMLTIKNRKVSTSNHQSRNYYLKIEDNFESETDPFPLITFLTPSRNVELHTSFAIVCLLNHYSEVATLRLFKLSDDGRREVKVHEQDGGGGFLIYTILSFGVEDAAIYVCEALHGNIRTRKESVYNFVNGPAISNKNIIHYNQVLHANITLYCDVAPSFPTPSIKWYYNGYPMQKSHSRKRVISPRKDVGSLRSKLFIRNLDVNDQGVYQCITENTLGSDTKYFHLSLGTSEFAPKKLIVQPTSPVKAVLTWLPGKPTSTTSKTTTYVISWFPENVDIASGRFRTPNTSASITGRGLFGGRRYRFLVCLYIEEAMDYSDCVAQYTTMLQTAPAKAPQMFEPTQEKSTEKEKTYFVRWNEISDSFSMGIITNYTIYCQQINRNHHHHQQQQQLNDLRVFTQPSDVNSAHIYLPDNDTFKVWMTAFNSVGESPRSEFFYVHTAFTHDVYTDIIELSVTWGNEETSAATVTWKTPGNFTGTGFRLYYVQIPYQDYWQSFKSYAVVELDQNMRHAQVNNLLTSAVYRFTLAPVYTHQSPDPHCVSKRLGKISSAYLHHDVSLQRSFEALLPGIPVVTAPRDLKCYSFYRDTLLVTWQPPDTNYDVTGYYVEMFSDRNGVKRRYIVVEDTMLALRDLREGYWYGVRVRAYVKDLKASFYYTPFIACATKDEEPSKPRNVSHAFVYSKADKLIYLKLQWQRPLHTGANTYSYIVRRQASPVSSKQPVLPQHIIKVVFPLCEYSLIDGDNFGVWLVLEAMKTEGNNVQHRVTVSAVNDVREGEMKMFETRVVNIPDSWVILGVRKKNNQDGKSPNNNNGQHNDDNSSSNGLYLGVVVGLSVSAVFLAVLVVVCLVKEPCKKIPKEGRNLLLADDFLFVRKTKEMRRSYRGRRNNRQYAADKTRPKGTVFSWLIRPLLRLYRSRHSDSREESGNTEEALYSLSSGSGSNRMMNCVSADSDLQRAASAV